MDRPTPSGPSTPTCWPMASSHPAWSHWSDATVLDDYATTTTTTTTRTGGQVRNDWLWLYKPRWQNPGSASVLLLCEINIINARDTLTRIGAKNRYRKTSTGFILVWHVVWYRIFLVSVSGKYNFVLDLGMLYFSTGLWYQFSINRYGTAPISGMYVIGKSPPPSYPQLATSEMWCWSGGRGI